MTVLYVVDPIKSWFVLRPCGHSIEPAARPLTRGSSTDLGGNKTAYAFAVEEVTVMIGMISIIKYAEYL